MKISTTTNPMKIREQRTYPWLGVMSNLVVVLFSKEKVGTVVNQMDLPNYPLGTHQTTWEMDCFQPYYGEVRIMSEQPIGVVE